MREQGLPTPSFNSHFPSMSFYNFSAWPRSWKSKIFLLELLVTASYFQVNVCKNKACFQARVAICQFPFPLLSFYNLSTWTRSWKSRLDEIYFFSSRIRVTSSYFQGTGPAFRPELPSVNSHFPSSHFSICPPELEFDLLELFADPQNKASHVILLHF